MNVPTVQSTQFSPETSLTRKTPKSAAAASSSCNLIASDVVTVSDESKSLAAKAGIERNSRLKNQTNPNDSHLIENGGSRAVAENDLPVEAFALPSWYGDYLPDEITVSSTIDYEYWDLAGELTKDNHISDEERSQLRSYLDSDPEHQQWLANHAFRDRFRNEISEYLNSLGKHFREALRENGISSRRDYHEKVVLDKGNSEKIHRTMQKLIAGDSRFFELMEILGIQQSQKPA